VTACSLIYGYSVVRNVYQTVRPHVPGTRGYMSVIQFRMHVPSYLTASLVQGLGMLGRVITECMFVFAVSIPYFCHEALCLVPQVGRLCCSA
jgi:hypothetical protein